jgi:hypothetical protein
MHGVILVIQHHAKLFCCEPTANFTLLFIWSKATGS